MPKVSSGPAVKKRTLVLVTNLIKYANHEVVDHNFDNLECRWEGEDTSHPKLVVSAHARDLEKLSIILQPKTPLTQIEIKEALYKLKDFLEVLDDNRVKKRGSKSWLFTLNLFSKYVSKNIEILDLEWENKKEFQNKRRIKTHDHIGFEKNFFAKIERDRLSLTVFTTLESKFPCSQFYTGGIEEDFLTWLEYSFFEKYKINLSIIRANDCSPEVSRIATAGNSEHFKQYDILLGGTPEIHEILPNQVPIRVEPKSLTIPPGAVGEGKRWIGCYLTFLGVIWNSLIIDSDWIPYQFEDLLELAPQQNRRRLPYSVPMPGESSASYLLHYILYPQKQTVGDLNISIPTKKYSIFLEKGYINPRGSFPPEFIERGRASAGIVWLNDAVWSSTILRNRYLQLRAWLPTNSIPSIGCISVFNRPGGNQDAAQTFVHYFLSDVVQTKHYELQRRAPIRQDVRNRVLSDDNSSYSKAISEQLKNIGKKNIPLSVWDLFRCSNNPTLWRRDYLPCLKSSLSSLSSQRLEFLDIAVDHDVSKGWKLDS